MPNKKKLIKWSYAAIFLNAFFDWAMPELNGVKPNLADAEAKFKRHSISFGEIKMAERKMKAKRRVSWKNLSESG